MKDFYKFLKISILVYIIVCLTKKLFSFQENFSESCSSKCSDVNDELLSNPDPTSDTVSSDYIINYDVCTDDEQCSVYYKKEPDLVSGTATLPRCGFITNRDEPTFDVTDDEIKCDDNDIELPDRILPKCTDETHTLVLQNDPGPDDAESTNHINNSDNPLNLFNVCKKPDIGICRCSGDSDSETCEPGKCAVKELNLSLDGNNDNICKGIVGDAASGPNDLQDCEFIESDQSTDSCDGDDITCVAEAVGDDCNYPCKRYNTVTCDILDQESCSVAVNCGNVPSCSAVTADDTGEPANLTIFEDVLPENLICGVNPHESTIDTPDDLINCGVCSDLDITQKDVCENGGTCSNEAISVHGECEGPTWTPGSCSDATFQSETECNDAEQYVWTESGTCQEDTNITEESVCTDAGHQWIVEGVCSNPDIIIQDQCEGARPTWIPDVGGSCSDANIQYETECNDAEQYVWTPRVWTPYFISSPDIDEETCASPAVFTSTCQGVGIVEGCRVIEEDKLINDSCDRKLCVPKGSYLDNWNKNRYSTTLTDKTGQANKNGYCTLKDNSYLNELYQNDDNIYDSNKKIILENLCEKQNDVDPDVDPRNHDVNFCEGVKTNDNYELEWSDLIPTLTYSIHSIIKDDPITTYSIPKSDFGGDIGGGDFTGNVDPETDLQTFQFIAKNNQGEIDYGIIGPPPPASDGVTIKYVDRNQVLRKEACSFIFPTDQNGDEEIYKCQPPGGDLVDLEDELNLYYKCSKEDSSSGCDNPNNDFLYSESNPNTRKDKCEEISGCSYNVSRVCFGNTDSSEDVQCPDKYTRKRPSPDNDPHNGYISISDATDTTEEAKHELCCEPKSDFCEGNFESSNDIVCPSSFVNKGSDVIKSDGVENSGCCESEDEIYKPFFTLTIDDLLYNVMDDRVSYERKLKNDILNLFRENEFKKLDGEDQITEIEFTTEDIEILRIKDGSVIVEYRVGGEDNTERLLDSYNQIIKENIHLPTLGKDTFGTDPGGSSEEIIIEEEVSDDTTDFFGISFKTSYLIMCAIITSILCSVSFGLLLSLSAIK
jgi:hypothetical protein